MKLIIKLIAIFAASFLLTACGFHLRGQNDLPAQLKTIYIDSSNPYGKLEVPLKSTLESLGANVVDAPQESPIALKINSAAITHDNSNVVSSDQATIYNFTDSCSFTLINSKTKKPIIPQQYLSFTRQLTLQPNELLDTSGEIDTLEEEMNRDMIYRILNILNSKDVKAALAK